jgi:heme-degrading monooxygenase HmoA
MVLEHALITVPAGQEGDFEAAFEEAKVVLAASPGCRGARLHRGIEHPNRYLLLVEWDRLDDHVVGFRESPRFGAWRALVGPYFAEPPEVDHYQQVATT